MITDFKKRYAFETLDSQKGSKCVGSDASPHVGVLSGLSQSLPLFYMRIIMRPYVALGIPPEIDPSDLHQFHQSAGRHPQD